MGGGKPAAETAEALMDAAERLFVEKGVRTTTMEVIAREAGFSRNAVYRIFPNRQRLIEAAVHRTTQRYMLTIPQRVPANAHLVDRIAESLMIVATELVHDPLLRTVAEHSPDGTVAKMIANDGAVIALVRASFDGMLADDTGPRLRPGLRSYDVAQFIVGTALSMLLETVPGLHDPAVARRYIDTFIMSALIVDPVPAQQVFPDPPPIGSID